MNPTPESTWSWFRFTRNAALIATAIGLGAWYGVEGVYPNLVPKNFGTVQEDLLYRAGRLTPAATAKVVREHNIRTIIDFGGWDRHPGADRRAQRTAEELGVDRIVLPLWGDGSGDPNRYAEALRIIEDPARQPVLVHCAAGSERTGCLAGLWRMRHEGVSVEQVIERSREYGHDPVKTPEVREMLETWGDEIWKAVDSGNAIDYDGPTRTIPIQNLPDEARGR